MRINTDLDYEFTLKENIVSFIIGIAIFAPLLIVALI